MAFRSPRISSRVLQCLEPLQGRSSEEKEIQVVDAANRGDLESYWRFYLLDEDVSPKEKASSDLIIVFSRSSRPPVGRSAD